MVEPRGREMSWRGGGRSQHWLNTEVDDAEVRRSDMDDRAG